ncbi:MAG TPA: flagellin modification protein A [Candidatus Pacebacteria bacterium]|nr:MAG: Flagellin modification protein A [Microgenomates group bacterium GW2011_GWB1_45_17]KKU24799.1 MAG: Flagellin modification protein A [Microgenomates group bacterium GW2011_GWC1_46_15]HAV15445.1 flagellin modification protein A [Candidatus Paceibacterota bacterium]HCR11496.1 flagellin modification protein A [Candidatus Paceibacterota bacterium]HCR92955.1 flagellin modification protein A [Candidatus Paceibacterota bacterium]
MSALFSLQGKTIVITGGAGLLGSEFTRVCIQHGARVVIVELHEEKAKSLIASVRKEIKTAEILFVKCDITKEKDIQNVLIKTIREYKNIDVLINNAYPRNAHYGRNMEDVTYEDFCNNLNMHAGGYFLMTKKVIEVMRKQKKGNIINIASIYGILGPDFRIYKNTPMTMPIEYAAIKGAIVNMTKYFSTYAASYGIRVNSISPGGIFTDQPASFVKKYCERVPLGRMAKTKDIVGGVIYLASDASSYITGQNLMIDGGLSVW